MSKIGIDFSGSPALIYSNVDDNVFRTVVTTHDRNREYIILEELPEDLSIGDTCRILVLVEPAPQECNGKLKNDLGDTVIALFKKQVKESRGATRYKVNFTAFIENMIIEKQIYKLLNPIEVKFINISTTGMRFYAQPDTIAVGDRFQIRVYINLDVRVMIAQVVNYKLTGPDREEYGCRLLKSAKPTPIKNT